ncbi:hypothetical protein ACT3SZ_14450 [Corynebacterium sp. AOP40-9SA-29]|uniref:hypothetical protein n=1 Tax=Corynebacterium sp. AOP40-9SA-29 TaxID=3457677 RepID=UPI00403417DD
MPKYISRSSGEIVYPDQIRSGEVGDAVEVDQYPPQAAKQEQERYVPEMPEWTEETPGPPNPFGKWFSAWHVLLVLAVIGGAFIGGMSADGGESLVFAVVGAVGGGLSMLPLYLLTHIGSTIWQLKEEVRALR